MAIGTGTAEPTEADTALGDEKARIAVDIVDLTGNILTLECLFSPSAAAGEEITEIGIFDAASGGTLLWREKFSTTYEKTSGKPFLGTLVVTVENK